MPRNTPPPDKPNLPDKPNQKAFLIVPPTGLYLREDRCQSPIKKHAVTFIRPPMTLAYTAAMWEKEGVECVIKDYPAEGLEYGDFRKDLNNIKPDFLFINITAPTLRQDAKACSIAKAAAKKWKKEIITVLKGGYLFKDDMKILKAFPEVDIVVRADIDLYLSDIVSKWKTAPEDIKGISYRSSSAQKNPDSTLKHHINSKHHINKQSSRYHRNPDPTYSTNLDNFPFPSRHLMNNKLYLHPEDMKPLTVVYAARGCPARCKFCLTEKTFGRVIRDRSPKNLVDEIEECVKQYGIKNFFFQADTFTWKKNWMIEVCKEILHRKLKIKWGCNSRVDTFDEQRAKWMKKAGCHVIAFGIESGNQQILDKMQKGITLEQCRNAVKSCRKYGIASYGFFIIGFPWDTEESINETAEFAIKLDSDFAEFLIFRLMPGSAFYEMASEEGIKLVVHDKFDEPEIKLSISKEKLNKLYKTAVWKFHMRPSYIIRTLWRAKSPKIMINYIRGGIAKLQDLLSG